MDIISKFQKAPVEEYPNQVDQTPVVSVCVQTYNHVDYIKDCLEGILIQKTEFPFEILLGEDESNDGTREVCIDYAKRYPERIRLFLHSRENNIIINGKPTGRFNFLYNLSTARGQYIALCDGDDYWTDPLKLQKQVAFMESNPEFSACFHGYDFVRNNVLGKHQNEHKPVYLLEDLAKNSAIDIQTSTVLYINKAANTTPEHLQNKIAGSHFLFMQLAEVGKIGYIDETMSVYRVHAGGVYSGKTKIARLQMSLQNIEAMIGYFEHDRKTQNILIKKYLKKSNKAANKNLRNLSLRNAITFYSKSIKVVVKNRFPFR